VSWDESSEERWTEEEESRGGVPEFLFDPLGVVRRRWIAIVLCLVLGSAATGAVWAGWTPTYVAQATLLITSQQIPEDFVRSTVREDSLGNISAMLGEVLSQDNLSRVIEEKDLFPERRADTPRIDLVNEVRSRVSAGQEYGQSGRTAALVYGISYESEYPAEAAAVANALAELFVESSIERRNSQARRATTFLRRELERDERELREHAKQLSEFRRAHRGELPSELESNLRTIDVLSTRRESLTNQIASKKNQILSLTAQEGAGPSETRVLLDELRRELARESAAHTEEHPNVKALRGRVARLEEVLVDEPKTLPPDVKRLIDTEEREIARMRGQIADIDAELAELDARVDRTPAVEEELTALQQKEAVLREDYVKSMRKVEEAELAESLESAQQGGQVSILDTAEPPTSPKRPRWLLAALGMGATLGLAVALAVLLELVDPVVVSPRQLEGLVDRPVLGSFPKIV